MRDQLVNIVEKLLILTILISIISLVAIPIAVTPDITVNDIQFNENKNIPTNSETTYISELSPTERTALETGETHDSLGEYTAPMFIPTERVGYIITDSGLYTISATTDYGVLNPLVRYGMFLFTSGGFMLIALKHIEFHLNSTKT